jgi:hypothetical protein
MMAQFDSDSEDDAQIAKSTACSANRPQATRNASIAVWMVRTCRDYYGDLWWILGSPNIITPGQKIKSMMAQFDSDSEDDAQIAKSTALLAGRNNVRRIARRRRGTRRSRCGW